MFFNYVNCIYLFIQLFMCVFGLQIIDIFSDLFFLNYIINLIMIKQYIYMHIHIYCWNLYMALTFIININQS